MLGPLLFIMYIDELDSGISSNKSEFADDNKVGQQIHPDQDVSALQDELDKF